MNAVSRSSNVNLRPWICVSVNERLAAKVLNDCRKRQSTGSSMKRSMAHGPASKRKSCAAPVSSSQKHIAERKVGWVSPAIENGSVRALPACVDAAITVLVVPKSRPRLNGFGAGGLDIKTNTPPFIDARRDENGGLGSGWRAADSTASKRSRR